MEEFLLTRKPLSIVRIFTALVLEQVLLEDDERKKKLRSFGTGKKLAKW
ncbi:14655_t:CDS:2, partial [Funneliformis geosporum]